MTSGYFLGYQKRWLEDQSLLKLWDKSRRIGATYAESYEDVVDASQKNNPMDVWFSSADETAAKEYILYCKHWANVLNVAAEDMGEQIIDKEKDVKALVIQFSTGKRIHGLSSNPTAFRSKGGKLVLDEFAFHKSPETLWKAAAPIVTWGYPVRILSSNNGKGNLFYRKVSAAENGNEWSLHRTTIIDAINDGLVARILRKSVASDDENRAFLERIKSLAGDEDTFNQEYMCIPSDEASAWLPYDLIASVEDEQAGKPERYQGGHCYIGNDIAARNDLWVAWVIKRVGSVLWTREIATLKGASFAEQDRVLDELMSRYHVLRLAMDQTGMGEKPVEDATRRYGQSRVNGVLFTSAAKQELATIGKQAFEDRRIRIPSGSPELRNDLHKLQKITGATGIPRFVAESDSSGHADRAWACFLALSAASAAPYQKYDYQPVRPLNTTSFGGYGGFGQHKGMF